jgi:hypothetical protein
MVAADGKQAFRSEQNPATNGSGMDERPDTRWFYLRDVFPHEHAITRLLFRLAILKEDLRIEMHGMLSNDFLPLGDGTPAYHGTYFLRRAVITLVEINKGITNRHLISYLKRLPKDLAENHLDDFLVNRQVLISNFERINTIRKTLSAHADSIAYDRLLETYRDLDGPIRIADAAAESYFGVAYGAVLLGCLEGEIKGHEDFDRELGRFTELITRTAGAAIIAIDILLAVRLRVEGVWDHGRRNPTHFPQLADP